jgi:molybdopterin/thiamine biosynthesis adenylyltransferase
MADMYLHEAIYRGREKIEALSNQNLVICGAGALGSLMTDNLTRQGVDILKAHCFRSTGIEITAYNKRLEDRTIKKLLAGADVVIDTLDNAASRKLITEYCHQNSLNCLHLGMNADFGQVHWNEGYRVPSDVVEGDVCDYPLARNLILTLVAIGSEALLRYVLERRKENYSVTLRDWRINLEAD